MQRLTVLLGAGHWLVWTLAPAAAQSNRTFVSGQGADAGTCTLNAPCRSFAYAITQTNAAGEITVLDPAGYGPVTITKAISIINDGVGEAGITVATNGQDAITVTAGASDNVTLRGLTLVGQDLGNNGITVNSINTLLVQNCVVRGFTANGINAVPSGSSHLAVSATILSNNHNDGLLVAPTGSGTLTAALQRLQTIGNGFAGVFLNGLSYSGTISVSAAYAVADGNAGDGFAVDANGPAATLTLNHVRSVFNGTGIASTGPSATVELAKSAVIGNTTDGYVATLLGVINSYGNNYLINGHNIGNLTRIDVE